MPFLGLSVRVSRLAGPFLKSGVSSPMRIISCNISGKAYRVVDPDKPKPYDYKNKKFPFYGMLYDWTTSRFDDNTKLIVVDAPIAAGKTEFAKALADEFDMYHIQDANMDMRYINPYGFDMRQLDSELPDSVKSYDEKTFCSNPFGMNSAAFQVWMYRLRYSLYIDALAHILSTGQGVVIERSPFSDFVFTEAMFSNKYISKEARYVYNELKKNTILEVLRPHLVIYLDVPVSKVRENIAKRGRDYESNSKALSEKYLQDIEDNYKTKYLPEISDHAELLIYDWSEGGDVDVVVEDIERIDFDRHTKYDRKLNDWFIGKEGMWSDLRRTYADDKERLMSLFNIPLFDAPELVAPGHDARKWEEVWLSAPGMEYEEGFNSSKGDSNILFKLRGKKYVPF